MFQKRGQMTIFIAIGIVIVILVALGLYFGSDIGEAVGIGNSLSYPSEVSEVVSHIDECVLDNSENVIKVIGLSGGYHTIPENFVVMESAILPYFNYDGEDLTITQEKMESEIGTYIGELVDQCVDFSLFSGMEISGQVENVDVALTENEVAIVVSFPFEVLVSGSSYTVQEEYDVEISTDLEFLRETAEKIVDLSLSNPEEIDQTGILEFGVSDVTIAPYNDDSLIYILKHTGANEDTVEVFMFAEYYPDLGYGLECEEDYDCQEQYLCSEGACVPEEAEEESEEV
jgi:hypothetical protein